jgi:hypothetical protein
MRRIDANLIDLLAAGETFTRAAKLAGISRRTVTRRMANPQFRQEVTDARKRIVDGAAGKMAASMAAAADTLRRLLRSKSDGVRLRAATAILELGVKLRDATEIAERVSLLEAALQGRQQ